MSQLYIHENLVILRTPTTGSQDIVHTRNCHSNANGIRTKNMSSPPTPSLGGGHKKLQRDLSVA